MLKSGVASVDISPDKGEELGGYPHYPRNNTGVHDPLFASCLYVANEETEVAFVTLDLLFFSKAHVMQVRDSVQKKCGILGGNIMISCSHTHSGPWAAGRLDIESLEAGVLQPRAYVESLIEKIVSIVIEAKEGAFEAEFASGTTLCGAESGIGGNRRLPGGPHDPLLSIMAVRDCAKTVRGVFLNYTLHPTYIHEFCTEVTADYPGYLRVQVTEDFPQAVMGFSQGASGNQSSRYYRQGESFDEAERVGRMLGRAASQAISQLQWKDTLSIRVAAESIPLALRAFETIEELERRVEQDRANYQTLYEKYGHSDKREEYYLWQNANLKMLGSEDQLGYVKMIANGTRIELLENEQPAEIQVIRLGETCVIGSPGEVFVEFALYLKAMAGFSTVIFQELSNGCLPGYVYTPESLVLGGYETDTSMLHEGFGKSIVDKALELITRVKQK